MTKTYVQRLRLILKLLERWDFQCVICGEPFENLGSITLEHLKPVILGGKSTQENLALSHYACNLVKGSGSLVKGMLRVKTKLNLKFFNKKRFLSKSPASRRCDWQKNPVTKIHLKQLKAWDMMHPVDVGWWLVG